MTIARTRTKAPGPFWFKNQLSHLHYFSEAQRCKIGIVKKDV
jgi:hypothetical protein